MPSLDIDFTKALTPDRVNQVRLTLSGTEAEEAFFGRLRYLDCVEKLSYAERGLICHQVETCAFYKLHINPETGRACTFCEWLRLACPWSYATAFAAMRDVEQLKDVPAEELAQIPPSNFPILKQLSTEVRNDPAVLEAAKTKHTEDLVQHLQEFHRDQHIERTKLIRIRPSELGAQKIEEAVEWAISHQIAGNVSEAIERACETALEYWPREYEIKDLAANGLLDDMDLEVHK